jgi:hypothetical protein
MLNLLSKIFIGFFILLCALYHVRMNFHEDAYLALMPMVLYITRKGLKLWK